jgi:hypothetical protein
VGLISPIRFEQRSAGCYCEALKTKVEALGYMVRRVKIDDGCHKIYITDKASGGEVEAYYNPATGELVQAKLSR